MGCHTWFHKRLDIKEEQARIDAIYICEEQMEWNKDYMDNLDKDISFLGNEDRNCFEKSYKYFKRCLSLLKEGYFKFETVARFYEFRISRNENSRFIDGLYDFEKRTNSIYICTDDLPHDIFRIGGYPPDQLISFEETVDFMKTHECYLNQPLGHKYDTWDKVNSALMDFWNEYQDGMIRFG